MACFLGHMSGILPCGPNWAAELTDCTLTDSGPLEHVVRGASVLVTFLELIPRFRWGWRGGGGGGLRCRVELQLVWGVWVGKDSVSGLLSFTCLCRFAPSVA